jgi:hypothetical protein
MNEEEITLPISMAKPLIKNFIKELNNKQLDVLSTQLLHHLKGSWVPFSEYITDPDNFEYSGFKINQQVLCRTYCLSTDESAWLKENGLTVTINGDDYFTATIIDLNFFKSEYSPYFRLQYEYQNKLKTKDISDSYLKLHEIM